MVTIRMVALLFLAAGLVPSLAYAASDACCGDPLSCFCYKDENNDWKKGTLAVKIPAKAQTKGEKFKERDLSNAALKAAPKAAEKAKQ